MTISAEKTEKDLALIHDKHLWVPFYYPLTLLNKFRKSISRNEKYPSGKLEHFRNSGTMREAGEP